ncbi:MAG: HAD-IA family hydrolase [Methanomassiliicoccaceae archaeon]|nr:HAD-IA family hydrolase [Methanomassiliicoccaceae archaeon]
MRKFGYYIFDLDNTLVDSRKGYEEAFIIGFREFDMFYDPALYDEYIRSPLDLTFKRFYPNSPKKCKEFISTVMEAYDKSCINGVGLFPDAERCIERLIKEERTMGIVSNAYMSQINDVLRRLRIEKIFTSVVGRDRVAIAKPDPEPVLLCMKEMSASRDGSVMIGDSANDIRAGKGAGIFSILIDRLGEGPGDSECDALIASMDEL